MSKAKYHVPQPGEEIEFEDPSGFRYAITVAKWDSKHGIITTDDKRRVYVQNRSSIKMAEPVKEEVRAEAEDGLRWVDSSTSEPVAVPAAFTARLPTSFSSEVERAQVIADAEAEEKKRSEKVIDEMNRLADEIVALTNKRRDIMTANEDAEEDHQHRVDYLFSLRVRGE